MEVGVASTSPLTLMLLAGNVPTATEQEPRAKTLNGKQHKRLVATTNLRTI